MKKHFNHFTLFLALLTNFIYIYWRIFYTLPKGNGFLSMFFSIGLLIVEIIGLYELTVYFIGMNQYIEPLLPNVDTKLYPDVDVFIATYNEPVELVEKTVNGCKLMQYPDKNKVHIYICDDGKRTEMRHLAKKYNVGYITRDDNISAKAGNLNNAMKLTSSPLVLTLDADMIPRHHFLYQTVPYFLEQEQADLDGIDFKYPKIGFVQTPQSFYNTDLFQYNLFAGDTVPNEQDYFYRNIQLSRNASNSVIYCGSNTVLSRVAIDEIGGFYTNSITEDFATGILIQSKGYKCIATKEVLASGLSPSDLKSLIKQRERWGRGCIQTARRMNIFFIKGLTWQQKFVYASSVLYWFGSVKRFFYILCPIMFSVFGVVVLDATFLEMLIFYLPMFICTSVRVKTTSSNIRITRLTNTYETILSQALLPHIILETFGISKDKFSVTSKQHQSIETNYQMTQIIPFVIYAVLSVVGIYNILSDALIDSNTSYLVVLVWLVINLYSIIMAMFFIIGRKQVRSEDRFIAKVPVSVVQDDIHFDSCTIDLSTSGFSFYSTVPHYIDASKSFDATFTMDVNNEKYVAVVQAKIVAVHNLPRGYKFSCKIINSTHDNKNIYNAIVFDRIPCFPTIVKKMPNPIVEIKNNIIKRREKILPNVRKTIRVKMRYRFVGELGEIVSVDECNFTHLIIGNSTSKKVSFSIASKIKLHCSLVDRKKHLYKIDNLDELSNNKKTYKAMLEWMQRYKV